METFNKVKINELKGVVLKKVLQVKRCLKSYHNKHVDGSGNFGFVIVNNEDVWFRIDGNYRSDGTVRNLELEFYGSFDVELEHEYQRIWNRLHDFVISRSVD